LVRPRLTLRPDQFLGGRSGSPSADAELFADVRRLGRLGLVAITDHAIEHAVSIDQLAVDDVAGFWTMFNRLPHPRRSVPVPRRVVRALAAGFSRGVTAVVIATLIRSLFWHKEHEAYRTDGRTKREWIAEVFGIAPRTVTDARARLIELGWLVPLEAPQYLLNRYGTHDAINTDWNPSDDESGGGVGSASPGVEIPGRSATPDQNSSSPLTGNRNTRRPAPTRAGPSGASLRSALGSRKKNRRRTSGSPSIRDITPEDLRDTGRLLELHQQAVALGLARPGEPGRLEFVSLAERARSRGRRAGALFYWLLRERKTVFITLADEDEAQRRMKKHLYGTDEGRQQWGGRGGATAPTEAPGADRGRAVRTRLRPGRQAAPPRPLRHRQGTRVDAGAVGTGHCWPSRGRAVTRLCRGALGKIGGNGLIGRYWWTTSPSHDTLGS